MYNAGSSVGNIVGEYTLCDPPVRIPSCNTEVPCGFFLSGPIVFNSKDAPLYHAGLSAVLGVFVGSGVIVV
jgi:hypothetical protein